MARSAEDAARIIRNSLRLRLIQPSPYCQGRLLDRGLDMNDVMNAIRHGALLAIEDERYRWCGPVVDDGAKTIEVVFEIDEGEAVTVITVFAMDPDIRRGVAEKEHERA